MGRDVGLARDADLAGTLAQAELEEILLAGHTLLAFLSLSRFLCLSGFFFCLQIKWFLNFR